MTRIELKALPPEEAIAYFRQKGFKIGFDHRDVWQQEHQAAFTVAKAMQIDLLADIRAQVDAALIDGTTFETFKANLKPNLVKRGWWGRAMMTDPADGQLKEVQLGSTRRLKVIYDTNLRTAHSEGQWQRIQESKATLPYLMYDHTPSAHERKEHAAWDGLVLPADDPWWQSHYPVKAWGCKCRVIQMGQRQMDRQGLKVGQAPAERYTDYTNKRTGEMQRVPAGVDPEFNYPPGGRQANLSKMLAGKVAALPPDLRAAAQGLADKPALPPKASYAGPVGSEFRRAMQAGMDSIPAGVRQAVYDAGYSVVGGRTLIDIAPRLATAPLPRGYPAWATWAHADGVTLGPERIIAVAESALLQNGSRAATSAARVGALLRHEHGHALDALIGASDSPEFIAAYTADAATWPALMPRLSREAADDLRYLAQAGAAGRQEAFAELFAELHGGGTAPYIEAAAVMPRARDVVRAKIAEFSKEAP